VVAVEPAGDNLVEAIAERAHTVRVGPGSDTDSQMGPLISQPHRDRVAGYLDTGVDEGASLVVDGRGHTHAGTDDGFWLGPSLFDRVRPEMSIYRDEIFGPILCVVRADSYEEALQLVNASPYGNGTAIFTNDGAAARRFEHEVQAGMVGINIPIPVPTATFPFGGWKSSLFGDTHVYGTEGVHFYTRHKVTTARWPEPEGERALQLGFPRNA
jgi:malonate-semialdehyde dehydrogenase (acetylating)/methylmalonate-semialdehyde dehydrogenase